MNIIRLLICLPCAILLLTAGAAAQDPPPNAKWRLAAIAFEGLKSQPPDKIVAASGLQVGQTIDFAAVKAAAERLSQTGLFGKVDFRYRYSPTQIELTFELEEKTTGKKRCQFDNFVWFSDQEIIDAIKREMPEFDGTIPVSDFASGAIKKSLTRLLAEKKIAGEVVYELYRVEDKQGEDLSYMFKVKGQNLTICDIQFAGAQEELKKPLLEALKPLFKTEYSKSDVGLFVRAALLPIYTERGYLKADFQQSRPALGASGACANAVAVTLPVVEGLQYRWNDPAWSGAKLFSAQELNAVLKLKPGDVADSRKIEKSWGEVFGAYGKKGYLRIRLKPDPVFDDARRLVTYQVAITEGAQYRMGQVTIAGLPEEEAGRVKGAWGLKPGEVFNTSYIDLFLENVARGGMIKQSQGLKARQEMKRDDQRLIVDIVVKFER
ncbi:MAG TPA: POTRA domain-containing protein [Blastocatellia bacterium]|nr:POTRA domain-containing protein [Blastocatellia bacterium]